MADHPPAPPPQPTPTKKPSTTKKKKKKKPTNPEDQRVTIWNCAQGRKIAGNAAPFERNLPEYLVKNPNCERYTGQDQRTRYVRHRQILPHGAPAPVATSMRPGLLPQQMGLGWHSQHQLAMQNLMLQQQQLQQAAMGTIGGVTGVGIGGQVQGMVMGGGVGGAVLPEQVMLQQQRLLDAQFQAQAAEQLRLRAQAEVQAHARLYAQASMAAAASSPPGVNPMAVPVTQAAVQNMAPNSIPNGVINTAGVHGSMAMPITTGGFAQNVAPAAVPNVPPLNTAAMNMHTQPSTTVPSPLTIPGLTSRQKSELNAIVGKPDSAPLTQAGQGVAQASQAAQVSQAAQPAAVPQSDVAPVISPVKTEPTPMHCDPQREVDLSKLTIAEEPSTNPETQNTQNVAQSQGISARRPTFTPSRHRRRPSIFGNSSRLCEDTEKVQQAEKVEQALESGGDLWPRNPGWEDRAPTDVRLSASTSFMRGSRSRTFSRLGSFTRESSIEFAKRMGHGIGGREMSMESFGFRSISREPSVDILNRKGLFTREQSIDIGIGRDMSMMDFGGGFEVTAIRSRDASMDVGLGKIGIEGTGSAGMVTESGAGAGVGESNGIGTGDNGNATGNVTTPGVSSGIAPEAVNAGSTAPITPIGNMNTDAAAMMTEIDTSPAWPAVSQAPGIEGLAQSSIGMSFDDLMVHMPSEVPPGVVLYRRAPFGSIEDLGAVTHPY